MPSPEREIALLTRQRPWRSFGPKVWSGLRNLPRDTRGQDLIEYALMAGFVAVAARALMPNIAASISTVFSNVGSVLSAAAAS